MPTNLLAGANPAAPSASPMLPPGGASDEVIRTLMYMQLLNGAGPGGKTNVAMTPLELMQFKQTLSQQTQAQAQAQAEAAEKQRADETEQLVATVVERVCKTVGMPTAPTVPARTAKKQGAATKTDDEGDDDALISTGSRNSQRRQKRKQHQEAI